MTKRKDPSLLKRRPSYDTTVKAELNARGSKRPDQARARGFDTGNAANAALIDPDKPLTEKQKLFVKHWAQGDSIMGASTRAGYADGGTFAYRMARMPNVLRFYEAEKAKYEEAADMSRKKVMDMLMESFDMAKTMAEPHAMVSAAKEIGKMCGYYEPVSRKVEISVTGNIKLDQLNKMDDADLLRIVQQGSEVLETQLKAIADETLAEEEEEEEEEEEDDDDTEAANSRGRLQS